MPSRKQNLEKVYEFALNAIADGDWETAARLLSQLQRIEPGYRDVPQMLQFVDATRLAAQNSPDEEPQFLETPPAPKKARKPKAAAPQPQEPLVEPPKKKKAAAAEPTPVPVPKKAVPPAPIETAAEPPKKKKATGVEPAPAPAPKKAAPPTPAITVAEPPTKKKAAAAEPAPAPVLKKTALPPAERPETPAAAPKKNPKTNTPEAVQTAQKDVAAVPAVALAKKAAQVDVSPEPVKPAEAPVPPESSAQAAVPAAAAVSAEDTAAPAETAAPGFMEELEEALAEGEDGLTAEPKPGFQFTRRNIGIIVLLVLAFMAGLIFLSSRFSTNKPLTMKEKMASMAPPTATNTPLPTQTAAATAVPLAGAATLTVTETPLPPTLTPTITPTLGVGSSQISSKDGAALVYVPAGEFLMGPGKTKVTLDAFWIDRTEVTNAMFLRCVDEGACPPPSRNNYKNPDFAEFPVIWVNWFQAQAYCRWAGRRMPSDAEWEKAARGADGRLYPWGDDDPKSNLVNICDQNCSYNWSDKTIDDGYARTVPVGSYPEGASPYGALDMSGNVWEWVADWYDEQIYLVPPTQNPQGPERGNKRVIRGGSWNDLDLFIQTIHRDDLIPQYTLYNIGFRCAATP